MKGPSPPSRVQRVALGAMCLATILVVEVIHLPHPLTSLLLNGVFVFILLRTGVHIALAVALLAPAGAVLVGHVPPTLLPLVPSVAVGNCVLVALYSQLQSRRWALRVLVPAAGRAAIIGLGGLFTVWVLGLVGAGRSLLVALVSIQVFTAAGGVLLGETLASRLAR